MLRDLFSLFPAYAGVILHGDVKAADGVSFPRIRGGDPHVAAVDVGIALFSPHTRG